MADGYSRNRRGKSLRRRRRRDGGRASRGPRCSSGQLDPRADEQLRTAAGSGSRLALTTCHPEAGWGARRGPRRDVRFRQLQGEDEGPVLPLAGAVASRGAIERDYHVIEVRTHRRRFATPIARATLDERPIERLLERFGNGRRVERGSIGQRQRGRWVGNVDKTRLNERCKLFRIAGPRSGGSLPPREPAPCRRRPKSCRAPPLLRVGFGPERPFGTAGPSADKRAEH